ncbi:sulfide:quinone oxidoreductase [Methylohalomonas lacus]|uniref:Sulfide:quinone oxidoreductase n=1 Tax=Methylohalomonas lacus TaxID=398773 RepID=A0AAE3HNN4_9GAMM|nr:FAD/NAD(P)-binding oxidoreductase [Methylohalomonas lacus]MCS3904007.1 sulfide:quinone oxidoreductase [Methylohalomonas lacus]
MQHQIVIIGGGAAGITVAASLARKRPALDIVIVEPADSHYYQPAFTLVGGGAYDVNKTRRPERDCIPPGVTWIQTAAREIEPARNRVLLADGRQLGYEHLVVCPGLQLDWHNIDGLEQTLGHNGVCSNYLSEYAAYTWECLQQFSGGTALFTQPAMPIKCAGAPQKIMYLACDHWRQRGMLENAAVHFCLQGAALFGVPEFVPPLQRVVDRYGIQVDYGNDLVAVDGPNKQATFAVKDGDGNTTHVTRAFDMLHVTPPQSAPDFIKTSPLANEAGWVDVDQATLRHNHYENIYGLGDVAGTPNSKTAAAVRKQAPVVVNNLIAAIDGPDRHCVYDGYSSCPLVTSYRSVILAEFRYGGEVTPSFPVDPYRERYSMWLLKRYGLPPLYWDYMLKGYEMDIPHKARQPE